MSSETRTAREDRRVAYHKAGHAVMAHLVRLRLGAATIRAGDGFLGAVDHNTGRLPDEEGWGMFDSTWEHDRNGLVGVAGAVVEGAACGRHGHRGLGGDHRQVIDLALSRFQSHQTRRAWVLLVWHRAINILACPFVWPTVEAVAAALLARRALSPRAIRAAMRDRVEPKEPQIAAIRRLNAHLHAVKCPFLFSTDDG